MRIIKIALEYKCYPVWIYSKDNEFIDNDLVEELKNNSEIDNMLMNIQEIYNKLYKDDGLSFTYEGFKSQSQRKRLILNIEKVIDLMRLEVSDKYIIENCVEI